MLYTPILNVLLREKLTGREIFQIKKIWHSPSGRGIRREQEDGRGEGEGIKVELVAVPHWENYWVQDQYVPFTLFIKEWKLRLNDWTSRSSTPTKQDSSTGFVLLIGTTLSGKLGHRDHFSMNN